MPTVDFDDQASLAAVNPSAARSTFVATYTEDGMTVTNVVDPPDPRLGGARYSHYHLGYERPGVSELAFNFAAPFDAKVEPRVLQSHIGDQVIQLTYDPNKDGVPDPFQLLSMDVLDGSLNVGVRFSSDEIGVYNNLTEGFTWQFTDARDSTLTRATLEGFGDNFTVDNIVFEPVSPSPPRSLTTASFELTDPPTGFLSPEQHEFLTSLEEEFTGISRDEEVTGIQAGVDDLLLV